MNEYTVQPGDTFYSIARLFGITTQRLRAANPAVENVDELYIGQKLLIPDTGRVRQSIEVNAYTFVPFNPRQLQDFLPYLTYISIFGHEIAPDGMLSIPDSMPIVTLAKQADVAPLMVVTNTINGVYSGELLHAVLSNPQSQQMLIQNCIEAAQMYGFYGVNFGFEQLLPEDYEAYASFLDSAANQLHALGMIIIASIRLVVALQYQTELEPALILYSRILDRFILTPGDYACAAQMNAVDLLQAGLDFVAKHVTGPKVLLGIPVCCYQWEVPYVPGGQYDILPPEQADALIRMTGALKETDMYTRQNYFRMQQQDGPEQMIMCDHAQSQQILELVKIYNLAGVSFRTLNLFDVASFQEYSVSTDIRKLLP